MLRTSGQTDLPYSISRCFFQEALFGGCIDFGLPPPAIMNLKASPGGKRGNKTTSMDRPTEALPATRSKVMDPDLGEDNKGRWRASLAESGKVRVVRHVDSFTVFFAGFARGI